MPTLEERNESLLWFHADSEEWFPGDYSNYDGKHIIISMRHDWRVERSLRDFTHWMFAPKNPNQIPAAPKGKNELGNACYCSNEECARAGRCLGPKLTPVWSWATKSLAWGSSGPYSAIARILPASNGVV